ncbi:diaminobutyrate acetyltransferase [Pontibacter sp. JAM-7]|uniref:diaminobutyrate acetyltransferase n=1 Tax=Pontibacter sp. JAM-7 TaxID=3366581 RepID=UPI003AF877F2
MNNTTVRLRKPNAKDGYAVHQLISQCPPLDQNSVYCNLLQCSDLSDSCILAESDTGVIAGFISGYRPPARPDTLFIWQVALHPDWRGQGIALKMLTELFASQSNATALETTISPGNVASETLFARFFEQQQMQVVKHTLFSSAEHFAGKHDDEVLYRGSKATA